MKLIQLPALKSQIKILEQKKQTRVFKKQKVTSKQDRGMLLHQQVRAHRQLQDKTRFLERKIEELNKSSGRYFSQAELLESLSVEEFRADNLHFVQLTESGLREEYKEEDHEDHSYRKSSECTKSGLREEHMDKDQEDRSHAVVDRTDNAAEVVVCCPDTIHSHQEVLILINGQLEYIRFSHLGTFREKQQAFEALTAAKLPGPGERVEWSLHACWTCLTWWNNGGLFLRNFLTNGLCQTNQYNLFVNLSIYSLL